MELRWTAISLLRLPDCSFFFFILFLFTFISHLNLQSTASPLLFVFHVRCTFDANCVVVNISLLDSMHEVPLIIDLFSFYTVQNSARRWTLCKTVKKKTTYLSLTHGKNGCKNTKDDWLSVQRGDWIYTLTRFFDGLIKKALMSTLFDLVKFWVKTATSL